MSYTLSMDNVEKVQYFYADSQQADEHNFTSSGELLAHKINKYMILLEAEWGFAVSVKTISHEFSSESFSALVVFERRLDV